MWIAGESLLASDLNAEYNNILNNGQALVLPFTAAVDFDANDLILDGDGDTTIDASTDDRIVITIGSAESVFIGQATGNTGAFFHVDPGAFTATASTDIGALRLGNTNAITVPAGTTPIAAGLYLEAPNLTATGTITVSATLYIVGPATEATTDYALFVDDGTVRIDGTIELGNATDTTLARASAGDINIEGNIIYRAGGTDVVVADGGTGVSTLTDGGVLLGSGVGPITAMAVLADGEFIVGDGTTDPVAESGATVRASLGLANHDSIVVTAAGEATNSEQPCFRATNEAVSNVTGNGTDYTIVFATEAFDQNADFDGTSTFTAPVTGRYLLTVLVKVIGLTTALDNFEISIVTSNDSYVHTLNSVNMVSTSRSASLSIIADMDISDTATAHIINGGEASDVHDLSAGFAHFSGALIT